MKKRIMSLFFAGIMCVSLFGCSNSENINKNQKEEKHKIAIVLDTTITDGGWGASCYHSMVEAAKELEWDTSYTDNVKVADYVSEMTTYAEEGYDLIFAPGNQYSDAVEQVAEEYPDTFFCVFNGTLEKDNVVSLVADPEQIGKLAGALAGLSTSTNKIGFIGGMELDNSKIKLQNYIDAAKKVNDKVEVKSNFIDSFDDAKKGKDTAQYMIDTYDVDVMFGDASAVDSGVREALETKKNRFDIGQPSDIGSKDDPIVICSIVTDSESMLKECMNDVLAGTFGNRTIYGNLENGCLSVGTFSSKVSEEIQNKYSEIVNQIKENTF